jgi:hypothetical protein
VDGVLLEPLAALPLGLDWSVELDELDAPPAAGALGAALGAVLDEELEEPDGAVDGVVEPAEDEEALPGAVVRDTVLSPSLSQPVSSPAPSARDTATARVESLMCGPPWLGYDELQQGSDLPLYPCSFLPPSLAAIHSRTG